MLVAKLSRPMPARRVRPSHTSFTGQYAMKRLGVSVEFESLIERDFVTLMDFDRDVVAVDAQPLTVDWKDEKGKAHRYIPDFLVNFRDPDDLFVPWNVTKLRPWLVEVKSKEMLQKRWSEYQPKFRAAAKFAAEREIRFRVFHEGRIQNTLLHNAQWLLRFMHLPADWARRKALLETLACADQLTANELIAAICQDPINQRMLLPELWRLIAWREIAVDLASPVTMNSPLWIEQWSSGIPYAAEEET